MSAFFLDLQEQVPDAIPGSLADAIDGRQLLVVVYIVPSVPMPQRKRKAVSERVRWLKGESADAYRMGGRDGT